MDPEWFLKKAKDQIETCKQRRKWWIEQGRDPAHVGSDENEWLNEQLNWDVLTRLYLTHAVLKLTKALEHKETLENVRESGD